MNEVESRLSSLELSRRASYNHHQIENLTLDSGYSGSSSLRRSHSLQRPSTSVCLKVRIGDGPEESIRNLSHDRLAKNFEIFEANPVPDAIHIPFPLVTRFAMVRQLLDDRLALNTNDEIFDALRLSKLWRVKKKMRKKILERIGTMVNFGNMSQPGCIRQLAESLSKDEFDHMFQRNSFTISIDFKLFLIFTCVLDVSFTYFVYEIASFWINCV